MQINLQFNSYGEMRAFCERIVGEPYQKPDLKQLNESAKAATEIINRAEAKEEKKPTKKPGRKPGRKPQNKLNDILKEENARKPRTEITDEIRRDVIDYVNCGMTFRETANLVGISFSSVCRIMNGLKEK